MSLHICSKIKCGCCKAEYCPDCHNGCPVCLTGMRFSYTSASTSGGTNLNDIKDSLKHEQ